MAKQKISYDCTGCGYKTLKWLGCCPECKEWDSLVEVQPDIVIGGTIKKSAAPTAMVSIATVATKPVERMFSGIKEWDRVVGGGIMPSSLLILTGDPGIGKSTLLLQISNRLAQ
ncbi:MAG TPA: hypothetical protein VFF04_03725, partial [Candidatus Babeliales bacterium]|nr:hypothetical protein [Candidatus Babeliales bacterium]